MLINCVLYQEGKKIRDIPMDEHSCWTAEHTDSFVWVALKDATPEELAIVKHQFGLHELAVEDALHGHQRPKIEEYVYDHLRRISSTTEGIRDTIGTAIQVNLSIVTIEESEVTKRLAAWAAIVAVIPALAGIWGMNFSNMPDLNWTYGYPASLALMAGACGFLYFRFRAAKWL